MRNLVLKNTSYKHLQKAFAEWLDILGYAQMNRSNMESIVREFLHHLEQQGCNQLNKLKQEHYKAYFNHISTRANQRRGGALSANYLNKHIQALDKFYEFLIHKKTHSVPSVGLRQLKLDKHTRCILTQSEIQELYTASQRQTSNELQEAFNSRDRVLLTIFYGCGLRRNEGANLNIDDINFDTRILHVRKGKNNKERLVPFSKQSLIHLQEWIYDHRPILIKDKRESALFISRIGKPMQGGGLYQRLKLLQLQIDSPDLQNKAIGLHTLRHSIATHLLQNGMELTKIQQFLGHSSLETTQIYTHLVHRNLDEGEPKLIQKNGNF